MAFFTLIAGRVYAAPAGIASLYLVMSSATGQNEYDLQAAFADERSSFVFSAWDQQITAANADTFAGVVAKQLDQASVVRGVLWFGAPSQVFAPIALLGISRDGNTVRTALNAPIYGGLLLNVPSNMSLSLPVGSTNLLLDGSSGNLQIGFAGASAPQTWLDGSKGTIAFDGPDRGAVSFNIGLQRDALLNNLHWGFQMLAPPPNKDADPLVQWYPFASTLPRFDAFIPFAMRFDPSDPLNDEIPDRTHLVFAPPDSTDANLIYSQFRTANGWNVNLRAVAGPYASNPNAARFIFSPGIATAIGGGRLQLAPAGDFVIEIPGATSGTYPLMLGVQATEYLLAQPTIGVANGDALRFVGQSAAYAPRFPLAPVSPLGPPIDPSAPLLDRTYTTSWMTIVSANPTVDYLAQPKGATLYGKGGSVTTAWDRLYGAGGSKINIDASGGTSFPALPYAGVAVRDIPAEDLERFESQIVAPMRRSALARIAQPPLPAANADDAKNVTTPSGLLATLSGDVWQRVTLAKNIEAGVEMAFVKPSDALARAFQTSDLFLVIANDRNLSKTDGTFSNEMLIADWRLRAGIGNDSAYDDYANIMIVKGVRGALYDHDNPANSLAGNPGKWTQAPDFAQPGDDATELVVLSNWLLRYFEEAALSGDESLATFNAIAKDPNWTGILVLRADIAKVPDSLSGILAGIRDKERFKAHHFGVSISPVSNDPSKPIDIAHTSSMFGLISYIDPDVTLPADGSAPPALPARDARTYDFIVLNLMVRFENSAVVTFRSFAQVTLGNIFALQPLGLNSGSYASVVLKGSYQQNGGRSIYSLSSTNDTFFDFQNPVVRHVEITNAQMSTRDSGASGTTASWFSFTGFIDFGVVQSADAKAFDVFSFGSDASSTSGVPRTGLAFSNLGLLMTFPTNDPSSVGFTFDTSEIRFDPKLSTSRDASIYRNFALDIQGIEHGDDQSQPSKSGYATVVTDARLTGVTGGEWYGIRYRLDMGSPGALAGNVGLNAYVVTAWGAGSDGSSEGSYPALFALQLPGTGGGGKLLSLQTVIKLSIGQMRLTMAQSSFLLLLTDIALKFFGLLSFPPGGTTMFFLFGNPQSDGKPSGLGWYAMYARSDQTALAPFEAHEALSSHTLAPLP